MLAQQGASPVKPSFHGFTGEVERGPNLVDGHLLEIMEDDDLTIVSRQ